MKEIWKDIKGYEGIYQVSSFGRVKSLGNDRTRKEKILKPCKNTFGYLQVLLYKCGIKKNALIHRLVADAFINNPNNFPEINHIDEDKTNNNVNNLEWCSHIYNCNFGTHNERCAKANINNHKRSKKIICIDTGIIYPSTREIERQFGFAHTHISDCCKEKQKTAYNLHWKYVD